ncbi:MAG: hypothetical protein AAF640_08540 [Pseudomonadota bacterium]
MATYQLINLSVLLAHGLLSVGLIGALTHQCVAVLRGSDREQVGGFIGRYVSVSSATFAAAVPLLYVLTFALGAVLYPEYRIESRYALEELRLMPVVGLFEIKEHWGAVGLGLLPLYWHSWRAGGQRIPRVSSTLTLGFIVWFAFLTGHVVNNARGV